MAILGFLSLSVTGQINVLIILVFSFAVLVSFINDRYGRNYYLSSGTSNILAVLLLLYVGSSVVFLGTELLYGILYFLIFTQIIKLLSQKGIRDIVQIYILSFFQFLAGSVLTTKLVYGLVFLVYVAVAIWAIIVLTMSKESLEAKQPVRADPKIVTPLFLSTTFIISFCVFMISAVIFVSVPRFKSGYFAGSFLRMEELRSGFSDEVKLGRVGEIKLDNSPIMRVSLPNADIDALPSPLYWRGIALDHFDGTAWRATDTKYNLLKANKQGVIEITRPSSKPLIQEIITEPLDTDLLFAASTPVGFKSVPGNRIADVNDSYIMPGSISSRIKYNAYSVIITPKPDLLRSDSTRYTDSFSNKYLQLPRISDETKELAGEITSLDDNAYDKAQSVKRYLLSNLEYTRTLEKGSSGFPLDEFLFENRAGHCEYFATAFVVLLRQAGVAARVVNGFLGGEWNEHGQFFLIRESDAHSWTEVYFPAHGWVVFDATPEGVDELQRSSLYFISSYVDYLKFKWSRYIVDFTQRDQIKLFLELRNSWNRQKNNVTNGNKFNLGIDKRWALVIAMLALVMWVFVTRPQLPIIFGGRNTKLEHRASLVYKDVVKILSKKGFAKTESMTQREFAVHVQRKGGEEYKLVASFTEKYLSIRYGREITEQDLQELKSMYIGLKKEIRNM